MDMWGRAIQEVGARSVKMLSWGPVSLKPWWERILEWAKKWCWTLLFQNLGSWKEHVSKMFWTSTGPFLRNHNVGKRKQPCTFSPEKGSGKSQREDLCRGMQALPSSPRLLLHLRLGCQASGSDLKLAWTWVWSLGDNKPQACNMEDNFISTCRLSEESHNKQTIPRTTGGVEVGHASTQWELTCGKRCSSTVTFCSQHLWEQYCGPSWRQLEKPSGVKSPEPQPSLLLGKLKPREGTGVDFQTKIHAVADPGLEFSLVARLSFWTVNTRI